MRGCILPGSIPMPRHGPQGERGGLLSLLALCLEEVDDLCCVCLAGCVICLAAADGHEADVAVGINRVKDYVDLVRAGNLKLVVGINGAALLISDALGNSLGSRALGRYALGSEGNAAALDENIFSVLLY